MPEERGVGSKILINDINHDRIVEAVEAKKKKKSVWSYLFMPLVLFYKSCKHCCFVDKYIFQIKSI